MTLPEFIAKFNLENTILLLEGKRNVLESDKEKLIQLGSLLATRLPLTRFRSGICEINKVPYFTQKDWEKWILKPK